MTEEEEVLAVKLAMLGIGIWSNRECVTHKPGRRDPMSFPDIYAIVRLGSEVGGGTFLWNSHNDFYSSRMEAMETALKVALEKARAGIDIMKR